MTTRVFFFLPSTVYQLFQRIVIDDTSEWTNAGCKVRTNLKRKRKKRHASRTIDELNLYTYILYTKHANLSITTRKKERKKETNYKTIKKKKDNSFFLKHFVHGLQFFNSPALFLPLPLSFHLSLPHPYFTHLSFVSFVFWIHRKNIALVASKRCIRAVIMRYAARVKREKRKERGRKEGRKRKKKKEEKIKGKRQKSFAAVKYRSALKRIKTQASFRE